MTRQRITPVAVLLAAVLAMGAGIAKAQETVRFAVNSSVIISSGPDSTVEQIIVTGVLGPVRTFDSKCSHTAGFDGEHNERKVVVIDKVVVPCRKGRPRGLFRSTGCSRN